MLDALSDDSHPKEARFEPDENRVFVTVYTLGDDLTDHDIHELEAAGEAATDGIPVVIELTDEDPPTEDGRDE